MTQPLADNGSATSSPVETAIAVPGSSEHEYNSRLWAPDYAETLARHRQRGQAVRAAPGVQLDLAWGTHERQKLDLFLPPSAAGPLVVHIHGGFWQVVTSGKDGASFVAPGFLAHGCAFAALQYTLCPQVDMDGMVRQLQEAMVWVWRTLPRLGYLPRRTILIGHSAGAHLAAMLALTDWSEFGLASRPIEGVCGISGLYDLRPLLSTSFNQALGMDPACAARNSPLDRVRSGAPTMLLVVGGLESASFLRQTDHFAKALAHHGVTVQQAVLAGRDHFNAIEVLTDTAHPLTTSLLRLCDGAGDR
jgi:arylformamidase